MRFAVCNEIYVGADWPTTCRLARQAGFTGIEIAPHTFAEAVTQVGAARRAEIRRIAGDHGLAICALHMLLFSPKGLRINGPDAGLRGRTVEYLGAILDFAADLGCPTAIYGSPPTRAVDPAVGYAQARVWMKEGILAVMEKAKAAGITVCIEPLTAECTNLFTTAEAGFGFVQEVGHPNFGLMIDTKSCATEKRPVEETISLFGPWLKHLHVNDATGKAPGFGITDFGPILKAIPAAYQGWVSCEPFSYQPDAATVMPVSLAYLRSLL